MFCNTPSSRIYKKKKCLWKTLLLPQGNSEQHWNSLKVFSWTKADSSNGLQFTIVTPVAFSLIWTENHIFFFKLLLSVTPRLAPSG